MEKQDIMNKAKQSNLSLNETELEYAYQQIRYNIAAVSTSMSRGVSEDVSEARNNLKTDKHAVLTQFIEWLWSGEPCKACNGVGYFDDDYNNFCETCEGSGYLATEHYTQW